MFRAHPAFIQPDDNEQKLWRYLDFTKFVSLLETKALYLPSLYTLAQQDAFEGMLPDVFFQCRSWRTPEDVPEPERWRLTLYTPPGRTALDVAKASMEEFAEIVKAARKVQYVSCWHLSEYESVAMWAMYASKGDGISITSSRDRLTLALQTTLPLYAGKVIYSDYSKERFDVANNILSTVVRKRRSFDFEREFRVVYTDDLYLNGTDWLNRLRQADVASGIEIPCDVSALIDEVHVSPDAPAWLRQLVQSVLRTYGVDKQVRPSILDAVPHT